MAEEREIPPYREVQHDVLIDYFIEKKVKPECPSCDHGLNEIHVRDNLSVTVVTMPGIEATGRQTAQMNPHSGSLVIICECANCGHFRTFSYPRIMAWALQREKRDE